MSSDPLMDAAGSNAGLAPRLLCREAVKFIWICFTCCN